jgi:hypothetical protein
MCGYVAYPYTITLLREDGLLSGVGRFETAEEATAWALDALAQPGSLATYAILTNSVEETTQRILTDPLEFPCGEFDDGAHWRQPAEALSPLSPGEWASEPCGDADDWRDRHAPDFDSVPVGRYRCGGLVVTQPGTTRVVCVECGADYPESPGWE